jgi:hypothetical protein
VHQGHGDQVEGREDGAEPDTADDAEAEEDGLKSLTYHFYIFFIKRLPGAPPGGVAGEHPGSLDFVYLLIPSLYR